MYKIISTRLISGEEVQELKKKLSRISYHLSSNIQMKKGFGESACQQIRHLRLGVNLTIFSGCHYNYDILEKFEAQIRPLDEESFSKYFFCVEGAAGITEPQFLDEGDYMALVAKVFDIPLVDPIVVPTDKRVVNRLVAEDFTKEEIMQAFIVPMLTDRALAINPYVTLRFLGQSLFERIPGFFTRSEVSRAIEELEAPFLSGKHIPLELETWLRTIQDRRIEISNEYTAEGLEKIWQYALQTGRTDIFIYCGFVHAETVRDSFLAFAPAKQPSTDLALRFPQEAYREGLNLDRLCSMAKSLGKVDISKGAKTEAMLANPKEVSSRDEAVQHFIFMPIFSVMAGIVLVICIILGIIKGRSAEK